MPAIAGKPPSSCICVRERTGEVPFPVRSMVAKSRRQERENRSTSGVVRGSVGTARVWSDSQRAQHRAGDDCPTPPDPPIFQAPDLSDETIASAVRDAVLQTLDRHGISAESRDKLALELRARILAALFCELSPVAEGLDDAELASESSEPPPAPAPLDPWAWLIPGESPVENALGQRLRSLETNHARWPEVSRLLIQVALRTPCGDLDALEPEDEETSLLRRRIVKLERALEEARATLEKVSVMERIDPGVASIYRGVQGLSKTDPLRQAKREMLELVFRANVALQRKAG